MRPFALRAIPCPSLPDPRLSFTKMIFSHIFLVFQEHQFGEVQQINQKFSTPHLLSSFTTKKCFLKIGYLSLLPRYSQIPLSCNSIWDNVYVYYLLFWKLVSSKQNALLIVWKMHQASSYSPPTFLFFMMNFYPNGKYEDFGKIKCIIQIWGAYIPLLKYNTIQLHNCSLKFPSTNLHSTN